MKTIQSVLILVVLLLGATAKAGWETDFRVAQAKALRENKAIMINFTGSDWCGWCQKLKSEVFNQSQFVGFANQNLVLLEIDFPRQARQSPAQQTANRSLASKFGVRGYPTVVILNPAGRELGRSGYRRGGPAPYIKEVTRIVGEKNLARSGGANGSGARGLVGRKHTTLKLQSITGRKRRLAMLNDTTFSEGEAARVRLGDSKVLVRCVKIKEKSVVVAVGDEKKTREIVWKK